MNKNERGLNTRLLKLPPRSAVTLESLFRSHLVEGHNHRLNSAANPSAPDPKTRRLGVSPPASETPDASE
jgi:hypothetical protein